MHILNVIFLPINVLAPDNFGIVEPFPRNIFAIEFTSANVTCVAYDSLRIKIPEKIIFVRRDEFGRHHEITANGKLYFTERTEGRHRLSAERSNIVMNAEKHSSLLNKVHCNSPRKMTRTVQLQA